MSVVPSDAVRFWRAGPPMSARMRSLDMANVVKMMCGWATGLDPMSRLAATRTKQKVLVAESRSDETGL